MVDKPLDGKVALVTGASSGIGEAVAEKLAGLGASVAVCARREELLQELATRINDAGGSAKAYKLDVADPKEAAEVVKKIHEDLGRIDILVNNAGIVRDQLLVRMKESEWHEVINVNLNGVFNVTRAVAKIMMKQRSGRIINVTSVVALSGNPGQANYCASKAALIGFTKALARELGSRNVTVNAVAPGFIETPMTAGLNEEQRKRLLDNLAIRRLGTPEDVAEVVAFLAGPGASYITGTVINVSGGLYM